MAGINWSQKKLEELKNKRAVDQLNLKNEASRVQNIIQDYYVKKRETAGAVSFLGSVLGAFAGGIGLTPTTFIEKAAKTTKMGIGGSIGGGLGSLLGAFLTPKSKRVEKAMIRGKESPLMPYLSEDLIREEDKTLASVFLGAQKGYSRGKNLSYWSES